MSDDVDSKEYAWLRERQRKLAAENAIAQTLARAILSSHPYDSAADGVACIDVWRAEAVRLLQQSQNDIEPQPSGIDNLLDELAADIDSMSDEEILAESSPEEVKEARRAIDVATRYRAPQNLDGLKVPPSVRRRLLGSANSDKPDKDIDSPS